MSGLRAFHILEPLIQIGKERNTKGGRGMGEGGEGGREGREGRGGREGEGGREVGVIHTLI